MCSEALSRSGNALAYFPTGTKLELGLSSSSKCLSGVPISDPTVVVDDVICNAYKVNNLKPLPARCLFFFHQSP